MIDTEKAELDPDSREYLLELASAKEAPYWPTFLLHDGECNDWHLKLSPLLHGVTHWHASVYIDGAEAPAVTAVAIGRKQAALMAMTRAIMGYRVNALAAQDLLRAAE